MYGYYDLLLDLDAEKAVSLAQEMSKIKQDGTETWVNYVKVGQMF
nr:hypothetical protein [Pedobacter sp. ASV19]